MARRRGDYSATFSPSTYSTGLSFPGEGLRAMKTYGEWVEDPEYGFVFITAAALMAAKKKMEEEETSLGEVAQKHWLALVLAAGGAYYVFPHVKSWWAQKGAA